MDLFLCLQFPRSDAKSHSQTQIESHLNLALRGLEATQHQVHEFVTVVKNQSKQIERLICKDKEQLEKMERLMSKVEDQSQQIKRLMSKDKEQSEKMERSISTVQGQPPQRESRGPISQILPTPFEWEIPNIRDYCNYALRASGSMNLVSKPFYLFERGYKYSLQIKTVSLTWPFELHVYVKVVPGEFDELLSWPCKEKLRVTWNYQEALFLRESKSNVIDFEKGRGPCSRPLCYDHHEYQIALQITHVQYKMVENTITIIVNRE